MQCNSSRIRTKTNSHCIDFILIPLPNPIPLHNYARRYTRNLLQTNYNVLRWPRTSGQNQGLGIEETEPKHSQKNLINHHFCIIKDHHEQKIVIQISSAKNWPKIMSNQTRSTTSLTSNCYSGRFVV